MAEPVNEGRQPYSGDSHGASDDNADAPGTGLARPIIATATLVALLLLFFTAGFWQLSRADEKRAILEQFATATSGEHIVGLVPDDAAEALRFRSLQITGRYAPERQILLDNMLDGGRSGYQVLTPFVTGGQTVLVNRGWVVADADRTVLPGIEVGGEPRTIVARINTLPAPGLKLEPVVDASRDWPRRLLFPAMAELSSALGVELPAYQLQLDAEEPDGYLRTWTITASGPEKHLGYAFQWFSFAALACLFYALLMRQWLRARRRSA